MATARGRIGAALLVLLVAVQGMFFHPPGWNQNARLAATAAFVEPGTPYTGTFRIDGVKEGRFPTDDWAISAGGYYSNKAPGISLLGIVPYFVLYHAERLLGRDPLTPQLTQINAYLLNLCLSVLPTTLAAWALVRRLPRLGVHSTAGASLVAMVYAFATLVLPFGCSPWGHATSAAFLLLGALDVADDSPKRGLSAGLWFGLALLTEYLAAVSLVTAGLFVLWRSDRSQRWWRFAAGAAVPILILLVYQKICFGSYFTPAASMSNPVFLQSDKVAGLFGVPNPGALVRILFAAERGFFFQTPILLLSAAGAVAWYRSGRRAFPAFAAANIVLYASAVSSMDGWHGGVTSSMRYMIITVPFFCMLLPDLRDFRPRPIFLLLFVVSAVNMFVLAATTTMYGWEVTLSGFAYPDFWRGKVAFNPVLAVLGVQGGLPALAIAVVYALALGWMLRSALAGRREAA